MIEFIELTADDLLNSKILINPSHIAMIAPEGMTKTKLAINGMIIVVKEGYSEVYKMVTI